MTQSPTHQPTDRERALADYDGVTSEILKCSAILLRQEYTVAEDAEDWNVKVPASVLHQIAKQNQRLHSLAVRLSDGFHKLKKIRAALTAPATPTDERVREAVERIRLGMRLCAFPPQAYDELETLITAATSPKQAVVADVVFKVGEKGGVVKLKDENANIISVLSIRDVYGNTDAYKDKQDDIAERLAGALKRLANAVKDRGLITISDDYVSEALAAYEKQKGRG